jgi:hypothetical protein
MAAPEGNQFWKIRSKHGRDKLFATSEKLWEAACEYFEWCDNNPWAETTTKKKGISNIETSETTSTPTARPYTLSGLCIYLGCSTHYISQVKASLKEDEEDFSSVITRIEEVIYTHKFEGATVGAFNANIISRDLGLRDKRELSGPGGGPIEITGIDVVFVEADADKG